MDSALRAMLSRLEVWSRFGLRRPLRPYQVEAAAAILNSVRLGYGDVITVMMSRQAGKNELSAQLESFLLANRQLRVSTLVKVAPTFKPQVLNSLIRLQSMLELSPVTAGRWRGEHGYIIRLGMSRILFFSTARGAQIVGATASELLEIDESQDVDRDRYDRDLSPMAASTNATRVHYGTAWDDQSLLFREIEAGRVAEDRDGRRRNFAFPWHVVAESNPAYGRYVEGERDRLGPDHPLFVTQYDLRTLGAEAGLFSQPMRDLMHGSHLRLERAADSGVYVAGLDVAGSSEEPTDAIAREVQPRLDSTVLLIGRVEWQDVGESGAREPVIDVVGCLWMTGRSHGDQRERLIEALRETWGVSRVVVDRTGLGQPLGEFVVGALGDDRAEGVALSAVSKSELGYGLLASCGSGRFRWWAAGPDDVEASEFWAEAERARRTVKPNRLMSWSVPESLGHDDFLTSAALLVRAARSLTVPAVSATITPVDPYGDGRR